MIDKNNESQHLTQEKIWEYFQNEAPESFRFAVPRLRYLSTLITPGSSVLNIGIGSGYLEKIALEKGIKVHSLDPDKSAVEKMQKILCDSSSARVGNCENIPFEDDLFDAVVMSEVLEHLSTESISLTLPEVTRVLKNGGKFIGTVPARESLNESLVVCPHCSEKFHRWGHLQSFTIDSIEELLAPHFSSVTVTERFFPAFAELNAAGKIAAAIKSVCFALGVRGSNENITFVAGFEGS